MRLGRSATRTVRTGQPYVGRPSGTSPVGPAMAAPTFELGRIYFFNFKKHCKLFKIKSIYKNKATSSNRKIATSSRQRYSTYALKPGTPKAILYADRSDWRNSPSVSPTVIANFADRSDWRIISISSMSDRSDY